MSLFSLFKQCVNRCSARKIFVAITVLSMLSLIYSFYAEFYLKFEPCPLCVVQRIIIIAIMLFAIIFSTHTPRIKLSTRIYGVIIAGLALFNIKVAAHHVWLINLPIEQQPLSCGMPLNILYQRVSLPNFLQTILQGDAECAKLTWTILGMQPPYAVIILCGTILLLALLPIFKGK
ncbi:MAG: protein dithiol:quinone oxidoreductase [Pseudomonadota bacterium]|nr:protein dithiol:quinone oxidoreductase [Pseudomonadota bacterium]